MLQHHLLPFSTIPNFSETQLQGSEGWPHSPYGACTDPHIRKAVLMTNNFITLWRLQMTQRSRKVSRRGTQENAMEKSSVHSTEAWRIVLLTIRQPQRYTSLSFVLQKTHTEFLWWSASSICQLLSTITCSLKTSIVVEIAICTNEFVNFFCVVLCFQEERVGPLCESNTFVPVQQQWVSVDSTTLSNFNRPNTDLQYQVRDDSV